MNKLYTFDDVLIEPKFSDIRSRKDVNLSVSLPKLPYVDLPIISANMDTVTGAKMANAMAQAGGLGCLHRFCSIEDNIKMLKETLDNPVLVSVGLGNSELERAMALYDNGASVFVVDVANGAQLAVVEQVKQLNELVKSNAGIIVGNFATGKQIEAFYYHSGPVLAAVKVGIGPGSACTTRLKTGVGVPQLSAIIDCVNTPIRFGIPVIADGGMRTPGDIAKALGAGASMVMLGGMLSGTDETPGEVWHVDGLGSHVEPERFLAKSLNFDGTYSLIRDEYSESFAKVKKYRGSASKEAYEAQNKIANYRTAEGESFAVPYKGPVAGVLQDIEGGLRSALTYVGARNLKEFKERCEFMQVTNNTVIENSSHGKR